MSEPLLDYPVNILCSYHYFKNVDIADFHAHGLRIIGDSGAFSAANVGAHIDRDAFYEWADRWRASLAWTASLDVIGDPDLSWANWRSAPPDLYLVPTIHYGEEPRTLDRYAEAGCDFLGLGGMVPFKSEPDRLMRWCLQVMRYARDQWPDVRFHGWGISRRALMMDLPWWSVDSSGFGSGYRYGLLRIFDHRIGKIRQYQLDGRNSAAYSRLLRDDYGVHWKDILTSSGDNRRIVMRVSARSAQLMERFLQRRHNVAPPRRFTQTGPNVSIVDAAPYNLRMLYGPHLHTPYTSDRDVAKLTPNDLQEAQ